MTSFNLLLYLMGPVCKYSHIEGLGLQHTNYEAGYTIPYIIGCRGALTQPPSSTTDEEKDYQDMICLGRKGGCFSQGEKGPEPLSPGAFIRFIRIGIQIKLINHCQSVRVKQYKIYREL